MDQGSIKQFLHVYSWKLRAIAKSINEEMDEFEHTIWVAIAEFGQQSNREFDPNSESDCAAIIRRLNRAAGRRYRANLKGLSLDQSFDGAEDNAPTLMGSIRAANNSDPLEALHSEAEEAERLASLVQTSADSYSQHSAYVMLLLKFEDINDAASHLAITVATLKRRIQLADELVRKQPSLFDRIVTIGTDFVTPRRFSLRRAIQSASNAIQNCLEFFQNCVTGRDILT